MFKIPETIRTLLIYLPIGAALTVLLTVKDYWVLGALLVTVLVLMFTRS